MIIAACHTAGLRGRPYLATVLDANCVHFRVFETQVA